MPADAGQQAHNRHQTALSSACSPAPAFTAARWIWAANHADTPNFYLYARRQFELPGFGSAGVCVTCSSEYKLYINGRFAGRGPGPCDPEHQYYDLYDLSYLLRPGKNVIAALCYNYGVDTSFRPRAPGGFLLQAEVECQSGDIYLVATDQTWKVLPGQEWERSSTRLSPSLGFQEVYDSRRKPVGWNVVGFDDSDWHEPLVGGAAGVEPWTSLVPRPIPRLKEVELFPGHVLSSGVVESVAEADLDIATRMYEEKTIERSGVVRYSRSMTNPAAESAEVVPGHDAFVVLDFGREVVGYPCLRIRDGGQATIDIGCSEALDAEGKVFPTRQGVLQGDRLILHGGRQEWKAFNRRALRYMQLTFRDVERPVLIESVSMESTGYPVERVSSFECSDDLINDVWRAGVHTLSVCMQDLFEDSPLQRSRRPDGSRVQALASYYCFSDTALAAKTLAHSPSAERGADWIIMLHDHYLHTGDLSLVEHLYPHVRLLLEDEMRARESENGLLKSAETECASPNAFYYRALRDASKLAAAAGHNQDSVNWHARAESVLHRFGEQFWSEADGAYADCCISDQASARFGVEANAIAVAFGLADARRARRVGEFLLADQARLAQSGPCIGFYVLQALISLARTREALDLIRRCWGGMLARGATTWWEEFESTWPEGQVCPGSLCHGGSCAPTFFLPAQILGVRPSTAGSDVSIVQPRLGDVDWAKGHIQTHSGYVDVEWRREDGAITIDIDAPGGYIAGLPVEGLRNPQVEEHDLSPETPERRARRTYGWGNVIWRDGGEHDPYLDWLRTQEADPPEDYDFHSRCCAEDDYIWVRESRLTHARYVVRSSP